MKIPIIKQSISLSVVAATMLALALATTQAAQSQTLTVIHDFTGGKDGSYPKAGLTMDKAGNFYGMASYGGTYGLGSIYKLTHSAAGGWVFAPLYSFTGGTDGAHPEGNITIGPDGTLYGVTEFGGTGNGTVFNLKPPPTRPISALSPWVETVLYRFAGDSDGAAPRGRVTFDSSGVMYGTTVGGGVQNNGVVFSLTPAGGGSWAYNVLYAFTGAGGRNPSGGVIIDSLGNFYGVTLNGGSSGWGSVYELALVDSAWTETTLHSFQNGSDGIGPVAPLIFGHDGNIYGGTETYDSSGGSVFVLKPSQSGWDYSQVYDLPGHGNSGVMGQLMTDANGNVYGTAWANGAYYNGTAFELSPSDSGWTLTTLHDFARSSDGGGPWSNLILYTDGKLYGTTEVGGAHDQGVIFEIAP